MSTRWKPQAAREHLDPERGGISVVRSAFVAGALETGCTGLLRVCGRTPDARLPQGTATALVAAIVAALDFQASLDAARERRQRKPSFATFADAREAMVGMEDFDIAAVHGFWSWSRFTRLYRLQFGETPSQTRSRAKRP